MANQHAESFAEVCREDDEKFQEARKLEDGIEESLTRLKECLVLRHQTCMDYVRDEIEELITKVRNNRKELATTYNL